MGYLPRLGARWDSADAAAVFDAVLVRPSRSTLLAALAALALVLRDLGMFTSFVLVGADWMPLSERACMERSGVFLATFLGESPRDAFHPERRLSSELIEAVTDAGVRLRIDLAAGVPNDDCSISRTIAPVRPSLLLMTHSSLF
jgi:hypothetical protein